MNVPDSFSIYLSSGSLTSAGNLTFTSPSTYTFKFPQPMYIPTGYEVGVYQFQITNSIFNITSALNNNTFSYYSFKNSSLVNLTIPNGFYGYSDFNGYLISQMLNNGDYLVNANGQNVYYIAFQVDSVHYATVFTLTPLPASLPSGWTDPNNLFGNIAVAGSPGTPGYTTQIVIPSTNIQYYFGTTPGTYPAAPATVATYVISNTVPQVSSVVGGIVNLQGINNSASNNYNNILYFPFVNVQEGGQYVSTVYQPLYFELMSGNYPNLIFYLTDQSNNPLQIVDSTELVITLHFKKRKYGQLIN